MNLSNKDLLNINYALHEYVKDVKNNRYPEINSTLKEYLQLILRFNEEINKRVFESASTTEL